MEHSFHLVTTVVVETGRIAFFGDANPIIEFLGPRGRGRRRRGDILLFALLVKIRFGRFVQIGLINAPVFVAAVRGGGVPHQDRRAGLAGGPVLRPHLRGVDREPAADRDRGGRAEGGTEEEGARGLAPEERHEAPARDEELALVLRDGVLTVGPREASGRGALRGGEEVGPVGLAERVDAPAALDEAARGGAGVPELEHALAGEPFARRGGDGEGRDGDEEPARRAAVLGDEGGEGPLHVREEPDLSGADGCVERAALRGAAVGLEGAARAAFAVEFPFLLERGAHAWFSQRTRVAAGTAASQTSSSSRPARGLPASSSSSDSSAFIRFTTFSRSA